MFILTSCEHFHVDIAKKMHSNNWDFQHKEEEFLPQPRGSGACLSSQVSCSLAAEVAGNRPSCADVPTGSRAPALLPGCRAFIQMEIV